MGRPKRTEQLPAPIKIETAFWHLLGKKEYSDITIQNIADTAGVNRNAVYYHYENVDDVAKHALQNFLHTELVDRFIRQMLSCICQDGFMRMDEAYMHEIEKIQLCAKSNSKYLNQMLKDSIKDKWFQELNIDESKLCEMELLSIEFALSGVIAVLGSDAVMQNPGLMLKMPETEMGRAAIQMLLRFAEAMESR